MAGSDWDIGLRLFFLAQDAVSIGKYLRKFRRSLLPKSAEIMKMYEYHISEIMSSLRLQNM